MSEQLDAKAKRIPSDGSGDFFGACFYGLETASPPLDVTQVPIFICESAAGHCVSHWDIKVQTIKGVRIC